MFWDASHSSGVARLEQGSSPAQACMQELLSKAKQGTNPGPGTSLCSTTWHEMCLGVASGQGLWVNKLSHMLPRPGQGALRSRDAKAPVELC